jgi:hypothetical protein
MDTIPDDFKCPITLDVMKDPVLCEDGFTYERSAIISLRNSISPMTRQPIDKTKLIPNRALKNVIEKSISTNVEYQNILKKQKTEEINLSFENYLRKRQRELKLREERLNQEKYEYMRQKMGTSF